MDIEPLIQVSGGRFQLISSSPLSLAELAGVHTSQQFLLGGNLLKQPPVINSKLANLEKRSFVQNSKPPLEVDGREHTGMVPGDLFGKVSRFMLTCYQQI